MRVRAAVHRRGRRHCRQRRCRIRVRRCQQRGWRYCVACRRCGRRGRWRRVALGRRVDGGRRRCLVAQQWLLEWWQRQRAAVFGRQRVGRERCRGREQWRGVGRRLGRRVADDGLIVWRQRRVLDRWRWRERRGRWRRRVAGCWFYVCRQRVRRGHDDRRRCKHRRCQWSWRLGAGIWRRQHGLCGRRRGCCERCEQRRKQRLGRCALGGFCNERRRGGRHGRRTGWGRFLVVALGLCGRRVCGGLCGDPRGLGRGRGRGWRRFNGERWCRSDDCGHWRRPADVGGRGGWRRVSAEWVLGCGDHRVGRQQH